MLPTFNTSKIASQMAYFEILPTHDHKFDPKRFSAFFQRLADVKDYWYRFVLMIDNGFGTIYMACSPEEGARRSFLSALKTACPEVEIELADGIPTAEWPSEWATELCPKSDILPLAAHSPEPAFETAARMLGLGHMDGNRGVLDVCFDPLSPGKEAALRKKALRKVNELLGVQGGGDSWWAKIERQLGPQTFSLDKGRGPRPAHSRPQPPPASPEQKDLAYLIKDRFLSGGRLFRGLVRCSAHTPNARTTRSMLGTAANVISRSLSGYNQMAPRTRHGAAERLRKGVLAFWEGNVFTAAELAQLVVIPSADSPSGRHIKMTTARTAAPPPEMLDFGMPPEGMVGDPDEK